MIDGIAVADLLQENLHQNHSLTNSAQKHGAIFLLGQWDGKAQIPIFSRGSVPSQLSHCPACLGILM